ncbi:Lysine-specific histone demethylase 1B [Schistosoma japonicum]|nr:Lysine-specific histone demethylase 1B [Schistosoma japonicum]
MNISGFEINHGTQSQFCENPYCSSVIPLCFAGINTLCARNRSKSDWYHFSFGEHVCSNCFESLNTNTPKHKSQSVSSVWRHRMNLWRREWLKKSSQLGRRRILNAANFLAAQMLPWWLKCNKCSQWRQLPPQTPVGSTKCNFRPDKFTCADIVKVSDAPCSWPVDERVKIVISKPQDFLASMHTHAWLQASPALKASSSYGVDLAGLSPDPLPGFTIEDEKTIPPDSPFRVFEEDGAFSPIDLHAWERFSFSEMSRFPTLYLAVRNLVLCLWFRDPKRLLTSKFAANHCFIRGLLRIVLCEHWIPHLIEELTCRGLINIGVCQIDLYNQELVNEKTTDAIAGDVSSEHVPHKFQLRLISDSDLTAAVTIRQVWNALYLRQSHTLSDQQHAIQQQPYFPFCVKLISSPGQHLSAFTGISNNNALNELTELILQFPTSNNNYNNAATDEVVTNGFHKDLCDKDAEIKKLIPNNKISEKYKQYPILHIPSLVSPVQIGEDKNLSSLFVPLHSWSDRIYTYSHHPVSMFAWQTGLELHPTPKCLLLRSSGGHVNINESTSDHDVNTLIPIPFDQSVRIEFHVEAVLDLVIQLYSNKTENIIGFNPKLEEMEVEEHLVNDNISNNTNSSILRSLTHESLDRTSSVEDCWDEMDSEVRKRLTDLTGDSIEQSLIEYFLASIEYDLTEPLTTNFTESSRSSMQWNSQLPTARFDQLPVCHFNETATTTETELSQQRSNLDGENLSAYTSCVIRTPLTINHYFNESDSSLPGPISYLWDCLTKDILANDSTSDDSLNHLISIALENNDFDGNTSSFLSLSSPSSDENIIDIDSSLNIVSTPSKSQSIDNNTNHMNNNGMVTSNIPRNIRLNYINGTELVDWVIVTTPIDRIRLHFLSKSLQSNDVLNQSSQYSKQPSLSIYLPLYLRPILIDEHYLLKNESYGLNANRSTDRNVSQCSTNARLITITLIYSSSWWRQYTTSPSCVNSNPSHADSSHGDNKFSELFSFLPDSRENRGFCHVFRDLRPDINSPGILQTQIFAAAADHWWDKADVLLETSVDRYLKTHFLISSTDESQLLTSYIARLQTPSINSPTNCVCVVNEDSSEQWLHIKQFAWMELVKRTGIFIVNLMRNENYVDYTSRNGNYSRIGSNNTNCLTASELIYASNPLHNSSMDAVTSAVQAGLELANLTLHLLPHRNQSYTALSSLFSLHSESDENLVCLD